MSRRALAGPLHRRLLSAGALCLPLACSGEVTSGVAPDAGSVTQFEHVWWGATVAPRLFLLIVDDAPTDAARQLREALGEDLRGFFDDIDLDDCLIQADPAVYRPIDFRLIVVGSSGTMPPLFRDEAGLHALGIDASPEILAGWEMAGADAIRAMEAPSVLPFMGAAELAHYVNLLGGTAEPRNSAEEELAHVVTEGTWPWMGLATTRPDESPDVLDIAWQGQVAYVHLLDWPEDGTCPADKAEHASFPSLVPLGSEWTSKECFGEASIFDPLGVADCYPACMPRAPAVADDGRVACRVYGEFPLDVDCETAPGWTFIEQSNSIYESTEPRPVNLCELRQAEGRALQACISDFACEECEPSFCFRRSFTAEDGEDPAHERPTWAEDSTFCEVLGDGGPLWERLRLVHGADQVGGFVRAVCQE